MRISKQVVAQLRNRNEEIEKDNKSFEITSVCRLDIQSIGFDTSTLTDEDMKNIARKMADNYCECCFWNSLEEILVEVYKLEQHDM